MAGHVIRDNDLTWREIDEEVIVLDLVSSKYLSLNGTGALLWKRLATGAEDDQLVDLLTERFGIAREVAETDVAAFLDHCTALGLVR